MEGIDEHDGRLRLRTCLVAEEEEEGELRRCFKGKRAGGVLEGTIAQEAVDGGQIETLELIRDVFFPCLMSLLVEQETLAFLS